MFRRIIQVFLFVYICVVSLNSPHIVHAQTRGITVIPPKFELFSVPGDTLTERVRLINESTFPITVSVVIEDFTSAGEEGEVALEEEGANTSYSLAKWVEPSVKDIVLQPGEESAVSFDIVVPRDAEPGGHYASILFASGGESIPGGAAVTQRIGSLILLRVSGNVEENGVIETFSAPTYLQSGPVDFTLRLLNEGNVHIQPRGTIVITNLLNQKVAELPLEGANVLPGAVRKMDTTWEKTNLFGTYTATLVATYGQQNLPLTAATRFTVASPIATIALIIGLIALVIFIISLFTGRKRLGKAIRVLTTGK
jgi:uncharacterized membrane protein YtjA (UPF0391 family)